MTPVIPGRPKFDSLALECPSCGARVVVNVNRVGTTTYVCPYCTAVVNVNSELKEVKRVKDD